MQRKVRFVLQPTSCWHAPRSWPSLTLSLPPYQDGADADSVMERSFWSGLTLNPPLYGADTPVSFFDPKLAYGWNLRDLGDLLRTKDVPHIPGGPGPGEG